MRGTSPIFKSLLVDKHLPGKIVDLGCGYGRNSIYAAALGWQVLAVDRDIHALRYIRKAMQGHPESRKKLSTARCDARTFIMSTANAEIILACMVLHYLDSRAQHLLITRIKASVRPGGKVLVSALTTKNPAGLRPNLVDIEALTDQFEDWQLAVRETSWVITPDRSRRLHVVRLLAVKPRERDVD